MISPIMACGVMFSSSKLSESLIIAGHYRPTMSKPSLKWHDFNLQRAFLEGDHKEAPNSTVVLASRQSLGLCSASGLSLGLSFSRSLDRSFVLEVTELELTNHIIVDLIELVAA